MFKAGDLCVIESKTSTHNGRVVEVVKYIEISSRKGGK